ncbi:MAG: protein-disulfide reductase DsbD [Gammaproteobacteria bacterium]|nr:protein-disulfide reductase DsbD [Gammaproteobacteria bacterium]
MPKTTVIQRLVLLAMLLAGTVAALADEEILRPEDAFAYAVADTGSAFEIDWAIADGYYLYKKKLSFESGASNVLLGDYTLPQGRHHEDEFFGVQQVYRQRFYVTIPYTVVGERPASTMLVIRSQGCADLGICYPPQEWNASVDLVAASDQGPKFELGATPGGLGDFLPVDEAFRPVVTPLDGNTVELAVQVAPGYYLYKDKITARAISDRAQVASIELPAGEMKVDEYFGEMEVYHNDVFGKMVLRRATPEAMEFTLEVAYQGCADGGICYPPVTRSFDVSLPTATAVSALAAASAAPATPVSEQSKLAKIITGSSLVIVVATFFGAGLLLAFTPCVLPMVPILSGIIAGEGDNVSPTRGFMLAVSYVMGMALIYTAAGVAAAAAGLQLQATFNQPWVLTLFSGLFVFLALGMFGMYDLQMPSAVQSRLSSVSGNQKSGTMVGAFVMGALSSLIVTACVAPALIASLTVMAQTGDMLRGGIALFAMSLGMGAPLLLVGAAQGKFLPRAGPWMVAVKNAFGFMMLGLAIWMLSRMLPDGVILAMWGALIFMGGVFLGGLTTLTPDAASSRKLGKGVGVMAVIYGAILLFGALSGGHSLLRPLEGFTVGGGQGSDIAHEGLEFQRIKTVDELDAALELAAAQGKTAMLDFYADWCVSCIEMEKFTFPDAGVRAALANTVLLQADVTANDEEDQALLARFGVFGPPTIIFFDKNGIQRTGYEVVGYMKAAKFIERIELAFGSNSATITAQTVGK